MFGKLIRIFIIILNTMVYTYAGQAQVSIAKITKGKSCIDTIKSMLGTSSKISTHPLIHFKNFNFENISTSRVAVHLRKLIQSDDLQKNPFLANLKIKTNTKLDSLSIEVSNGKNEVGYGFYQHYNSVLSVLDRKHYKKFDESENLIDLDQMVKTDIVQIGKIRVNLDNHLRFLERQGALTKSNYEKLVAVTVYHELIHHLDYERIFNWVNSNILKQVNGQNTDQLFKEHVKIIETESGPRVLIKRDFINVFLENRVLYSLPDIFKVLDFDERLAKELYDTMDKAYQPERTSFFQELSRNSFIKWGHLIMLWDDIMEKSLGEIKVKSSVINKIVSKKDPTRRNVAIFDIDGTVYDLTGRNYKIVSEWIESDEFKGLNIPGVDIEDIAGQILGLPTRLYRDGINHIFDYLSSLDIEEVSIRTLQRTLKRQWSRKFFSNDYLQYDKVNIGMIEYIKSLQEKGIEVWFLSGRMESTLEYTKSQFRSDGIITDQKHTFIFKKDQNQKSADFKRDFLSNLDSGINPVAFFENESSNIEMMQNLFTNSTFFQVDLSGLRISQLAGEKDLFLKSLNE